MEDQPCNDKSVMRTDAVYSTERGADGTIARFRFNIYSWMRNIEHHGENTIPATINEYGYVAWHVYGQLHREDGPAVIYEEGGMDWYVNGELHREEGPARISEGGLSWFIEGNQLTHSQHTREVARIKRRRELERQAAYALECERAARVIQDWWLNIRLNPYHRVGARRVWLDYEFYASGRNK
jgi:hypothetical protein